MKIEKKIFFRIIQTLFYISLVTLMFQTFKPWDAKSLFMDLQVEHVEITLEKDLVLPVAYDYKVTLLGKRDDWFGDGEEISFKSIDGLKSTDGLKHFSSSLEISTGSKIIATRFGSGDIVLKVHRGTNRGAKERKKEPVGNKTTATQIESGDKQLLFRLESSVQDLEKLADEAHIRIPLPKCKDRPALLFSFCGKIKDIPSVQETKANTQPILLSGALYIINKSLFERYVYEIGPFTVHPGDGVSLDQKQDNITNGLIKISKDVPGLQLVANAQIEGKLGTIKRFNHVDLRLQTSVWQKLFNDQLLMLFWSLLAFSFPFCFELF